MTPIFLAKRAVLQIAEYGTVLGRILRATDGAYISKKIATVIIKRKRYLIKILNKAKLI